ncbi:MAG: NAD(P)H-hydrate epimerase [Anaerolineaceae bacterium]
MMNFPLMHELPPFVTTKQMMEVDRLAMEDYHIELIQMMENAGRNLARLAINQFLSKGTKNVVVLAGAGGNGGGALVAARHLHNWGARVQVFLSRPLESYQGVTAHQLRILQEMQIDVRTASEPGAIVGIDLIIDGLIGYSLKGSPSGMAARLITWANHQNAPILSLDVPSGMDASTGKAFEPVIKADATMTLALPKTGFLAPDNETLTGKLFLADIGIPPELFSSPSLGLNVANFFAESEILRLPARIIH